MNAICGECFGTGRNGGEGDCYPCDNCDETGSITPRYTGPNYSGDLNACFEMEKSLDAAQWASYWSFLEPLACMPNNTPIIFATAAQRAEAFLRTVGKWKEAE